MGGHKATIKVHQKIAHKKRDLGLETRAPSDSCSTGGFYTSPKQNEVIDPLKPLTLSWDTSCLETSKVDIWLTATGSDNPRTYIWYNVPFSQGSYELELKPRWWNAKTEQLLQFNILPAGTPLFMNPLPAGPVVNAVFTLPTDGSTLAAADTSYIDIPYTFVDQKKGGGMTGGKTAAAVLVPLLFVAVCAAVFIKYRRSKGIEKRKKWTEAVDKRMSTISADWKSVSAAGAQAAIRNSMAVSGNRASSFSFGAIRPSSQFVREGEELDEKSAGAAGVGIRRPGVGLRNPVGPDGERVSRVSFATDRVSRVSFANDPRPSSESRRTKAFRDSFVPPVPALPSTAGKEYDEKAASEEGSMSPRQTQGPITLTPEDIRSRIAGRSRSNTVTTEKDVVDEDMIPALSMMRTGGSESNDFLFNSGVAPPAPTYPKPTASAQVPVPQSPLQSPVMQSLPMQPMPASVMSPDEMLRAYAERKKSLKGPITSSQISYPIPSSPQTSMSMAYPTAPMSPPPSAFGYNAYPSSASPYTTAYPEEITFPMPVADTTQRTLFSGTIGDEAGKRGSVGSRSSRASEPQLGFAPGEYDANFSFEHAYNSAADAKDVKAVGGERKVGEDNAVYAIGGDEDEPANNAAGRGAYGRR